MIFTIKNNILIKSSKTLTFFLFALSLFLPIIARGEIDNPLEAKSFSILASSISELAIEIGIPIAAIFIIYSGLMFVTARGNEEKLKKAKAGILWSLVGTGILLGAWAITEILKDTIESLN